MPAEKVSRDQFGLRDERITRRCIKVSFTYVYKKFGSITRIRREEFYLANSSASARKRAKVFPFEFLRIGRRLRNCKTRGDESHNNFLIKYLAAEWGSAVRWLYVEAARAGGERRRRQENEEERCKEDAGGFRREFQFPGDLWLPRRENRCRQPPNNHTSYDYHTPGVYTRAPRRILVSLPPALALLVSFSPACTRAFFHVCLARSSSSLPALLQIARRTLSIPATLREKLLGI